MSRLYYAVAILAAAILIVALITSVVTAPPAHNSSLPDSKYRELVKQLVSPNTAPEIRYFRDGNPTIKLPKNYDGEAQTRIGEVRIQLQDNIEEALPYLVEALDDKRYSFTNAGIEALVLANHSVGDACREVIASYMEVYREKIRFRNQRHWDLYNYEPISKEWWVQRKNNSVVELQIDAIDWAIKRHEDEPKLVRSSEECEHELEALAELRNELKESKIPAKPRELHHVTAP